jgi:hypothetical protein
MKSIKALYIYSKDTGNLSQILDCQFSRILFGSNMNRPNWHYYAEIPIKKFRTEIAEKSEEIFEDTDKRTLTVWLHEIDKDKAIEIIGNYILDRVGTEIKTHKSFINRLLKDQSNAEKLLESISEN